MKNSTMATTAALGALEAAGVELTDPDVRRAIKANKAKIDGLTTPTGKIGMDAVEVIISLAREERRRKRANQEVKDAADRIRTSYRHLQVISSQAAERFADAIAQLDFMVQQGASLRSLSNFEADLKAACVSATQRVFDPQAKKFEDLARGIMDPRDVQKIRSDLWQLAASGDIATALERLKMAADLLKQIANWQRGAEVIRADDRSLKSITIRTLNVWKHQGATAALEFIQAAGECLGEENVDRACAFLLRKTGPTQAVSNKEKLQEVPEHARPSSWQPRRPGGVAYIGPGFVRRGQSTVAPEAPSEFVEVTFAPRYWHGEWVLVAKHDGKTVRLDKDSPNPPAGRKVACRVVHRNPETVYVSYVKGMQAAG